MNYYVRVKYRDEKVKEYTCNERPAIDSMWSYFYISAGNYRVERSEMIEKIEVSTKRHGKKGS
jgi:ferric iron reductase protein FhuF